MIDNEWRSLLIHGFRLTIGLVWVVAAIGKFRAPGATADAVRRLVGGSPRAVNHIAQVLSIAELVLGGVLVIGWQAHTAAGISAAAFVVFAVVIGRAAIRDSLSGAGAGAGGCGCFGSRPAHPGADHVQRPRAIARNFVLAALAMAVVCGP
jgi:uncharacterized membrane protein YphA (DoxX/SURF4 family)